MNIEGIPDNSEPKKDAEINPAEIVFEEPKVVQNALVQETSDQRNKREQDEMIRAKAELEQSFSVENGPNPDSADHYTRLGISPNASLEEIRTAHRAMARATHPDSNKNDPRAVERFKKIQESYELLIDSEKRQKYDSIRKSLEKEEPQDSPMIKTRRAELLTAMEVAPDQLPAIIEKKFGGDQAALVKFVYEVDTQSGGLEELSGKIEEDAGKIAKFFDGYGMQLDEPTIQKMGAGIYTGAVNERKRKERSLLRMFIKIVKEFGQAIDK